MKYYIIKLERNGKFNIEPDVVIEESKFRAGLFLDDENTKFITTSRNEAVAFAYGIKVAYGQVNEIIQKATSPHQTRYGNVTYGLKYMYEPPRLEPEPNEDDE
jgi:hypothetical protein